jgi:hypothetical protein
MECLDQLINNSLDGQGEGRGGVAEQPVSPLFFSALKTKPSSCGKLLTKLKHFVVSGW